MTIVDKRGRDVPTPSETECDCTILMLRATDPAYSAEHRLCLLDEIGRRIEAMRAELLHETIGPLLRGRSGTQ